MRIAYLDCFSGISGDMLLAALVSAGVPAKLLREELKRLPVGRYTLRLSTTQRMHLTARQVLIKAAGKRHVHRTFSDIRRIISRSTLKPSIKEFSLAVFQRLADAEADIHHTRPADVRFHEVGALDSILDIVGTAIGIDYLKLDTVYASPLPLAPGFASGQHGTIPLPAPATIALLKGVPVYGTPLNAELVTPTGAALLTTLTRHFGPLPPMKVERTGYGAGSRILPDRPNLLRIILGEQEAAGDLDQVLILEANIDNMNPEIYDYLMERLFASGALDVSFNALQMKKNRPAVLLKVICYPGEKDKLAALILQESTTSGIRYYQAERIKLQRVTQHISTPFGRMEIKVFTYPDGSIASAPEYEACKRIALKHRIPLKRVYLELAKHIPPLKTPCRS